MDINWSNKFYFLSRAFMFVRRRAMNDEVISTLTFLTTDRK